MKVAFRNPRQLLLLGVLGVVLLLALVKMRGGSSGQTVPSSPVAASGGAVTGEDQGPRRAGALPSDKKLDPNDVPIITTRDLDSPGRREQTDGRNIFDFRAPTLPPPPTPTPTPPRPPAPGTGEFVGPMPPPTLTPTPLPPEITFKFIGTFGPKDSPIAVLSQGTETVNAREGDVVFKNFIIRKIGYESIDVGFVGRDPKDSKRLGLAL